MNGTLPDFENMLDAMISTPSVSSVNPAFDMGNRAVVDLIADWLLNLGLRTEVIALDETGNKANLVATLGDGDDGLVLAGHADTVPCDPDRWTHDPFRLTRTDDRLIGLGTTDMKGFLALAIEAAASVSTARLAHPLHIVVTADEESTMRGARRLADSETLRARCAVIGEPTSLVPVRMHKGVSMDALTITGRSGHSSDPRLGANAIDGMHAAIAELMSFRDELKSRYPNAAFDPPYPTMNLGHIHGGDNPNRICGRCELHYDLRSMPGMDAATLREELAQRVSARLNGTGLTFEIRNLDSAIPAYESPPDGALVRALEAITGNKARAAPFGTEAPFFARLGMETIVCGPGDIDCAHQPDEHLAIARIAPARDMLNRLIRKFCLA